MKNLNEILSEKAFNNYQNAVENYFIESIVEKEYKLSEYYKRKGYNEDEISFSCELEREESNRALLKVVCITDHSSDYESVGYVYIFTTSIDYPKSLNLAITANSKEIDTIVEAEIEAIKNELSDNNFDVSKTKNVTGSPYYYFETIKGNVKFSEEYKSFFNAKIEEKEALKKEEQKRKDAEIEAQKKCWIENHGSELLKKRYKLGYSYTNLLRNEYIENRNIEGFNEIDVDVSYLNASPTLEHIREVERLEELYSDMEFMLIEDCDENTYIQCRFEIPFFKETITTFKKC